MKISKEARKLSKKLFLGSFSEGRLDAAKVRTIAQTVIDKKPRKYADILKNYQRLIRVEVAKRHAVIESATELAGDMRQQLLGTLRRKYGPDLTTEFKISPDLIGGVRVKIASDVWDNSVRGHLSRLESNLATA
jgi:F-type H+-transporting ATPase subunit delta